MEQRRIERLGRTVSCVGFGGWQLGADWGDVPEGEATEALEAALAEGVTFVDTADVYGDGRSERIIGRVIAGLGAERPFVATKMGRRLPQVHENYTPAHFREWLERSRENLGMETLDLVQLHCPPTAVITDDALFDDLDSLVADGVMAAYGVSVETCDQALLAIARPNVATVQIILNAFRLKPLDEVLPAAVGGRGRDHRAGAARERAPERPLRRDDDVQRRRPSLVQHRGCGVRRGRDVLGRRLRDRPRGGAPPGAARAGRHDDAAVGASLRARPARHVRGDPGGAQRRAGARQRRRGALPPLDADSIAAIHEVYDELIRPTVHARW